MQNQIPNNWQKIKLGDVLELKYGFGLPEKERTIGNFPVYGSSGVVGWHNKTGVNSEGLIVGRKGNVGSIFYSNKPFYPIDTVYYIDSLKKEGNLKFFYYLLKKIPFKKIGSDVGVPGLNRDLAYSLEINIPTNTDEQKRIASILSSFDDKIELNNKINKTLEEMASAIFKEWFVKFRFPGWEKTEFVDSELGKIPKGWEEKLIKNFGKTITGKTPSTEDKTNFGSDYPFITIPDINNVYIINTERYLSNRSADKIKSLILPNNTICVSCIATVGLVGLTVRKSYTNQQINSIIPSKEYYLYYLFNFFRKKKKELEMFGSGGTATLIINKTKFENLEITKPEDSILIKFYSLVKPMYEKILEVTYENQKLAELRDLLLPKLMKGKVRVN